MMTDHALKVNRAILLALPASLLTLVPGPSRAELVVFTSGRVVKVASHRDAGDRIQIRFLEGGSLTFDRTLVEGIEEDEVAAEDGQVRLAQASPTQAPQQPPARVEASRPVMNEQMATPAGPQPNPAPSKAPDENRPPPTPRRHHRHRR